MTSQKPPKKPKDMTTDEAIRHLFHPKVVEHAKRHAKEEDRASKSDKKAMSED